MLAIIMFLPGGLWSLVRRRRRRMSPMLAAQGVAARASAPSRRRPTSASSFDADTVVSLIGANGAGKTTFLNMVTGYLKPDSGRILFDGRDIVGADAAPDHAARHLPLVPDPAAVPDR